MKTLFIKTICLGALAAALQSLNASAAGTVTFVNDSSSLVVNGATGNPAVSADGIQAALYWSPVGTNNFVQIGNAANVGTVSPGIFAGGTCSTGPETAGGTDGQFQVRAWSGGFATFEQAQQVPGTLIGQSGVIQVTTGDPAGSPPTPPGSLTAGGLQSFTLLNNNGSPVAVSIVTQPTNQTVLVGQTATFSVAASGTQPLSYQWTLNTTNIPNATNTTLTLTNVQLTDAGNYAVLVSDGVNSVVSSNAVLTVNTSSCTPPPTNLAAWWQAEGNAQDVTGNHNGTITTQFLGTVSFSPGKVGTAFDFHGSNFVEIQPIALTNCTIEFWCYQRTRSIKTSDTTFGSVLISDEVCGVEDDWHIGLLANGHLSFFMGNAVGGYDSVFPSVNVIPLNTFMHVAVTRSSDTGQIKIYLNGVLDSTFTAPHNRVMGIATPGCDIYPNTIGIGFLRRYAARGNVDSIVDPFNGLIDELAIYNRALSSSEIQSIYNSGALGKSALPPTITTQPTNQTVFVGQSASFGVTAAGTQPMSFQWSLNGTNLVNATNATLTLANVQLTDAGSYSVLASNSVGSVTSSNAVLTVNVRVCTPPPTNLVAWWQAEGNAYDAAGSNNGTLVGGVEFTNGIVGQSFNFNGTNAYITVPSSPATKMTGPFTADAWIKYLRTAGSGNASVMVIDKGADVNTSVDWALGISPAKKLRPHAQVGSSWVYFDCATTLNTGVWYHVAMVYNGTNLQGYVNGALDGNQAVSGTLQATDYPLRIGAYSSVAAGFFPGQVDELSLYNRALTAVEIQSIYNSGALGKCALPPNIIIQPASQSVNTGATVSLNVLASGTQPMSYQWFKNNSPLADIGNVTGSATSTLTLSNVSVGDAASYSVALTNAAGYAISSNAVLALNVPPGITTQPVDLTVIQGSTATFTVTASGATPFIYQWQKNGVNLTDGANVSGSATNTLTLNPVTTNDAGSYSVAITNVAGNVTSSNAVLTVNVPPSITTQPASQSPVVGSPATFSVAATGTSPLSYQWQKNNVPLTDGGTVSGSTTSSLTLSSVVTADSGNYSVVITNVAGNVTSSNAVLTVNAQVYVVATNTVSGNTVSVPVRLNALGTEVSVGFSLTFDPLVLTYAGVDDPSVMVNADFTGSGRLGLTFQNLGGYSAGDQKLVNVLFTANPVTANTNTAITFGDTPVTRQVIDVSFANITNVFFAGSTVLVVPAEYAADVYPRSGGDHTVNLQDWAEMGRLVAGLDVVSNADEMLRADCAPRGNPDGVLTVADWVQAGRYAAALDPLTVVNSGGGTPSPAFKLNAAQPRGLQNRVVQLVSTPATNGQTVIVPVNLQSLGNENALGFNVTFDPAQLVFKGAAKGAAAGAAQLNVNSNFAASGRLGIALALGAKGVFPAGTNQLVLLNFGVLKTASGELPLNFAATNPVVQQVCDTNAAVLTASYTTAVVNVPVRPTLQIEITNGSVLLTWPLASSNYLLQSLSSHGVDTWNTSGGSPSVNGTNLQVTLPATNPQQFYRLSQ